MTELKPMTADRALFFMDRFRREEKLLGPNEQAAVAFVIAMLESRTQPAITSESGKPAAQGASAITSVEVPRLTDVQLLAMWAGNDERALRPVLGSKKIIAYGREVEAALIAKWSKT